MADKEERDKKDSLSEKLKNPQWKAAIAAFLIFLILFTWTQYFIPGGPVRYDINYSKFLEQLDAGNIKSVSMKKLEVSGEFIKDIDILPPGQKKAIPAKEFRTFLPSFQGEGLLSKLEEKHVVINVEAPEEKSLFWQFIIGFLPWILIIGVWFFIMRRAQQQVQGGAGG